MKLNEVVKMILGPMATFHPPNSAGFLANSF